ncbi:MAG TPA: aminoglycoside phosphotransferase family protein [Clostridiales bacterium]|nr:aminoglycoside phosphotransferase family protein [Clostridiales bacterium]
MKTEVSQFFENTVKKEFPDLSWDNSELIESGWDHYILILDGKLVFRKPKDSRYIKVFENEISFMKYLKNFTRTKMPDYQFIASDGSFAGYELIQGRSLDTDYVESLNESDRDTLAQQIAGFLTDIHKLPLTAKNEFDIRSSDYAGDFNELECKTEKMLYSKLSTGEVEDVRKFLREYREMLRTVNCDTFLHNDLGGEHIFWDEKSKKIGVIDFSDREFGDPAFDFTGMVEFGTEFTEKVIKYYQGEKDNGFLYRAQMYFKRIPLMLMIDSMEGFPCTFEDGYRMMKKYW